MTASFGSSLAPVGTYVRDGPAERARPVPSSDRAPSSVAGRGRRPASSRACRSRTRCSSCISTSSEGSLKAEPGSQAVAHALSQRGFAELVGRREVAASLAEQEERDSR